MTRPLALCAAFALLAAIGRAQPPAAPAEPAAAPPARQLTLQETSCFWCHGQLDGAALEPTRHLEDIHYLRGLGCADCHGGDPAAGLDGDPMAAHDEAKGFRGRPTRLQIPAFCARCHSDPAFMKRFDPDARVDQLAEYQTSVHGEKNAAGDEKPAVCIDCHGVHGILAVSDPRAGVHPAKVADTCARCHADPAFMAPYGIPTDQLGEYRESVHAAALYDRGDTSAPTCNDCHGNHGAVPPGVDSVANVCGTCHLREATLFRETEQKFKIDLSTCIRCLVCHGNHAVLPPTSEMIGVGPKSTCTPCHKPGEPAYEHSARMGEASRNLARRIEEAERGLRQAERKGMEVGPDLFALKSARDQLVDLRVLSHSFDVERYLGTAAEGLRIADQGVAAGESASRELQFRRKGLAASLLVLAAIIAALLLKIRQMER